MSFNLSLTSQARLHNGIHPDMVRLVEYLAQNSTIEFVVAEGLRTAEEEFALWRDCHNLDGSRIIGAPWKTDCNGYPKGQPTPQGAVGTGESNHQSGHAVDLVVTISGKAVWDIAHYQQLADAVLGAAAKLDIPVVWGGTFPRPDPDHFELNRYFYP